MSGTRLNKYIASSGLCSRRKADELIDSGVVAVNGKKITELGYTVQPKDKVFVNGKMIHPVKHEYYRFYKLQDISRLLKMKRDVKLFMI